MKGKDRYSKSTNKKAIDTANDPYMPKLAPGGVGECKKCGVIHFNKRWTLGDDFDREKIKDKKVEEITCPACQKIRDGFAGGYVNISGEFAKDHGDEITAMIKNKEALAMRKNPLERLIKITPKEGGAIEVTTTTDKFAERIGQMLKKAFDGEVEYKWSSDTKLVRVDWKR